MRLAATLLAAAIGVAGGAAPATAESAGWLREICSDGELYYAYGSCAGYLQGVLDIRGGEGRFCPPEGTDIFALSLDAEAVLPGLPAEAGETAAAYAARILESAYPCDATGQ